MVAQRPQMMNGQATPIPKAEEKGKKRPRENKTPKQGTTTQTTSSR